MSFGDPSFLRYLSLLDIPRERPSIGGLGRIVQRHMMKVPFENISKLYRLKTSGLRGIPEPGEYLDGIEHFHFGGTCYSNNYYLNQLLNFLGYDAALCGADMRKPDVHIVSVVKVEGREFIVDAGYGAPFLDPLPRDLPEDFVIVHGSDRYVLNPRDRMGRSRLQQLKDGTLSHGYLVNPMPRRIDEFAGVIADSFAPGATFMNAILLARFSRGHSSVIRNMTSIENGQNTLEMKTIDSVPLLIQLIHEKFGMPRDVVEVALDGMSFDQNAWS